MAKSKAMQKMVNKKKQTKTQKKPTMRIVEKVTSKKSVQSAKNLKSLINIIFNF